MVEEVIIKHLIDIAIIKSFDYAKETKFYEGCLCAGAIKDIVKKEILIDEKDTLVQKRIEILFDRNILIAALSCESEQSPNHSSYLSVESKGKAKNRSYKLNANIKFKYTGRSLPPESKSIEIPAEIRGRHTSDLKEAIQAWITSYPEPKVGNPFEEAYRYRNEIEQCEKHPLFADLSNHLSDYEVCSKWEKYKLNIETLERDKWLLLRLIEGKIQECFSGLDLRFIPDSEYGMEDYFCTFIHIAAYHLILDLSGRVAGEDAWNAYSDAIYQTKSNTKLIENGSIQWALKMEGEILQVPKEKQDILMKGIDNYIRFLENIEDSSLIAKGKDIMSEVNALRRERDAMIKELKDALFHFSFPGDCRYLVGS
jgi:hypothetical protein